MIDFAFAADGAAPSALMQFAPLVLILLVFYFLIMRPQQKKFKAHQQMLSELKKGDKIITSSGIAGRITKWASSFSVLKSLPMWKWKSNATPSPARQQRKPSYPVAPQSLRLRHLCLFSFTESKTGYEPLSLVEIFADCRHPCVGPALHRAQLLR